MDQLRSSDPSIYAIGDAIETRSLITDLPIWLPLAGPANRQGRLVAEIISGREARYPGVLGTNIAKVFELTVASVGLNEKAAAAAGLAFASATVHPNAHAGYYPGALPLTLKILFTPAGRLLGAQAYWHEIAGLDPEKTVLLDVREPEEGPQKPFGIGLRPDDAAGEHAARPLQDEHDGPGPADDPVHHAAEPLWDSSLPKVSHQHTYSQCVGQVELESFIVT